MQRRPVPRGKRRRRSAVCVNDSDRVQERQPVWVLVGLQRRFMHEAANGEVQHHQAEQFLANQLRRLAAQDDLAPRTWSSVRPGRSRYPIVDASYKLTEPPSHRFWATRRFAKSGAGLDRVMGRPPSQTVWETLTPQRRRGIVLLLAQLALRRVQSPSRLEGTPDHGRGSPAASGRPHAREDHARASAATGDHLHPAVDASAG